MNKDPRSRIWRPRNTVLSACALLALAGCNSESSGGSAQSKEDDRPTAVSTCQFPEIDATDTQGWDALPEGVDVGGIASVLGVSTVAIENGLAGPVRCDPGIKVEDIAAKDSLVDVTGIPDYLKLDNRCLAFESEVPIVSGAVSTKPTIACPSVEAAPSTTA